MSVKTRHCVAQWRIHYHYPRINSGQVQFEPGDDIWVAENDYAKMECRGRVRAIDHDPNEKNIEIDLSDIFPQKSNRIWVFGDGPTARMPIAQGLVRENDIIFGVNRCFLAKKKDNKTPALALIPHYYVALDEYTIFSQKDAIRELPAIRKFLSRRNVKIAALQWPDIRLFDIPGEDGFSIDSLVCYHGKTSAYCALQIAVQCGLSFYAPEDIEIHLAGIDLGVLTKPDGTYESHHYGTGSFNSAIFPRMLMAFRYGLNFLNEIGVKWKNHSPLLEKKIEDLKK